jgi:hypothetical protein
MGHWACYTVLVSNKTGKSPCPPDRTAIKGDRLIEFEQLMPHMTDEQLAVHFKVSYNTARKYRGVVKARQAEGGAAA